MSIIMGLDYGDARTGIALSDPTEFLAHGAGCVKAEGMKKAVELVAEAVRKHSPSLIIVGNPVNMNGTVGPRSEKCRAFADMLTEATGIPCELFDERLTTVSAHKFLSETNVRGKKRKESVDELSATIILQDYLDRKRNQRASE